MPMLRLLSNTSVKANSLNANISVSTGIVIRICMPERFDFGCIPSSIVATIVIVNGQIS